MKNLLDDLWYSYQLAKNAHLTEEEKVLLSHILQTGDILNGELNTDQKNCLRSTFLCGDN